MTALCIDMFGRPHTWRSVGWIKGRQGDDANYLKQVQYDTPLRRWLLRTSALVKLLLDRHCEIHGAREHRRERHENCIEGGIDVRVPWRRYCYRLSVETIMRRILSTPILESSLWKTKRTSQIHTIQKHAPTQPGDCSPRGTRGDRLFISRSMSTAATRWWSTATTPRRASSSSSRAR